MDYEVTKSTVTILYLYTYLSGQTIAGHTGHRELMQSLPAEPLGWERCLAYEGSIKQDT